MVFASTLEDISINGRAWFSCVCISEKNWAWASCPKIKLHVSAYAGICKWGCDCRAWFTSWQSVPAINRSTAKQKIFIFILPVPWLVAFKASLSICWIWVLVMSCTLSEHWQTSLTTRVKRFSLTKHLFQLINSNGRNIPWLFGFDFFSSWSRDTGLRVTNNYEAFRHFLVSNNIKILMAKEMTRSLSIQH